MICRYICILCLLGVLAACATPPLGASAAISTPSVQTQPERFVVLAVDNPSVPISTQAGSTAGAYGMKSRYASGAGALANMAAVEKEYGLREQAAWAIVPLRLHCVVAELPPGASLEAILAALQKDPRVQLAQPLQRFSTFASGTPDHHEGYNDPYAMLQRGFVTLDAVDAHRISRGTGVRIAVIDTGADTGHPDLKASVAAARNFVDQDVRQFEHDRHGTEVAGVIAAVANNGEGIVGIAPEARLLLFKACWQTKPDESAAQCNSFTLAQALSAAIESDAQVINLSLGGPPDPLLSRLLERALEQRRIVVGAMPPDGRLDGFPLGVAGVIAVARADRPVAQERVLGGPGQDILTLMPGAHYDYDSGSSLAAAHVSAVVALLLARSPHLDARQVFAMLKGSARRTAGGLSIDACLALNALQTQSIACNDSTTIPNEKAAQSGLH
ncbi:MAG TPA: S8 family serine peptidase [Rhodocyclaceae bacterium]|nr:S8 family serine peptidase [Rhodocyclaceae bacterium]